MKSRPSMILFLGSLIALVLFTAAAVADEEVPLRHWTVPSTRWTASCKAVDATPPRAFIGLPPCRVIDTRGGAPLGAESSHSEARDFDVDGICGIPNGRRDFREFHRDGKSGGPPGPSSWPIRRAARLHRSSRCQLPGGPDHRQRRHRSVGWTGSLTINVSHSTHVIMDVNGDFSDRLGTPRRVRDHRPAAYRSHLQRLDGLHGPAGFAPTSAAGGGDRGHRVRPGQLRDQLRGIWIHGQPGRGWRRGQGRCDERDFRNKPVSRGSFWGERGDRSHRYRGLWLGPESRCHRMAGNPTGIVQAGGVLGFTGTSGVYSFHDITANGTKSFVEPHPIGSRPRDRLRFPRGERGRNLLPRERPVRERAGANRRTGRVPPRDRK